MIARSSVSTMMMARTMLGISKMMRPMWTMKVRESMLMLYDMA